MEISIFAFILYAYAFTAGIIFTIYGTVGLRMRFRQIRLVEIFLLGLFCALWPIYIFMAAYEYMNDESNWR